MTNMLHDKYTVELKIQHYCNEHQQPDEPVPRSFTPGQSGPLRP